jgi:hypothetical protein
LINGSNCGRLKSATEVAATDAKTTRGASRSKAEGHRGLQASRRRSTLQYIGTVSTADLKGARGARSASIWSKTEVILSENQMFIKMRSQEKKMYLTKLCLIRGYF